MTLPIHVGLAQHPIKWAGGAVSHNPKDTYQLPRIDTLVDSIARHHLLSFMDTFSGYNQIKMEEADQENTSFITSQGLFYYKAMPFGLKNAGATY